MLHAFLLWLITSLTTLAASCAPAPPTPTTAPPADTYEQHPGRTITEYRPAEVGPAVTIPGPGLECTEDMDCWICSEMGNLICGPTTTTNE